MSEPVDTPDRNTAFEPAYQALSSEAAGDGAEIVRDLRARHRAPPGVMQADAPRGYARQIDRLATGRLPLLAALQRRWSFGSDFPGGDTGLVYARHPIPGNPSLLETHDLQLAGDLAAEAPGEGVRAPGPSGHEDHLVAGRRTARVRAPSAGGRVPDVMQRPLPESAEQAMPQLSAGMRPVGTIGSPRVVTRTASADIGRKQ